MTGGVIFQDRSDAGGRLAERYDGPVDGVVVLGIARGGVPVGYPIARGVGGELDAITARKLPVPWSPEAGFGAVAPDGSVVLNESLMPSLRLREEELRRISGDVLREVRRRERVYRGDHPGASIRDRNVVLVDDGLATGYTMVASIRMARNQGAEYVMAAVPVSSAGAAAMIEPLVDRLLVLHVSYAMSFAVASFYEDFHDMDDAEVLEILDRARAESAP